MQTIESLRLTEVSIATPILVREKGKFRVGVAMPGKRGTDIYLMPGYTESQNLQQVKQTAATVGSAILGVLRANEFSCSPHTTDTIVRLDHQAILNSGAVEILDTVLKEKGFAKNTKPNEQHLSSLYQDTSVSDALCDPHNTSTPAWTENKLPQFQTAGGIGNFEIRRGLQAEDLLKLQAIRVPDLELQADTSPTNLLYVQATQAEIEPRLLAVGGSLDTLAYTVVEASASGLSLQETIQEASGKLLGNRSKR